VASPDGFTPGVYPAGAGKFFVDTSLNKVIVADGQVWRDPTTGAAV
jgi:hypothetical protein